LTVCLGRFQGSIVARQAKTISGRSLDMTEFSQWGKPADYPTPQGVTSPDTYESPGHTLDATALVHEAYLRLVGDQQFDGRGHFFAAAAEAMRRILVNHAHDGKRQKRGGERVRLGMTGGEG
jgi:hypothetical protein